MDAPADVTIGEGVAVLKQWIGTLLSLTGLGAIVFWLLKQLVMRHWAKEDREDATKDTNHGKQIDDNAKFRQELIQRIDKLEQKVEDLQNKLNSQNAENARLTSENEWLKRDNERLEAQNRENRGRIKTMESELVDLRHQVDNLLKSKSTPTGAAGDPLHVETHDGK